MDSVDSDNIDQFFVDHTNTLGFSTSDFSAIKEVGLGLGLGKISRILMKVRVRVRIILIP